LVAANAGADDAQTWLQANDAGGGPYTLAGLNQKEVALVWFDKYWEPRGKMAQSLIFRRNDESATMREELRVGTIDGSLSVLENDLDILEKEKGVVGVAYGRRPSVNGVFFNTRVGPTANPKVREAITLAYDYPGGFKGIHKSKGSMPAGPLPDTLTCRPDFKAPAQDLEKAKALLAESGEKDLTLTMRFQPAFKEQVAQATLLQSNLAEIGVKLNLEPIAFPNYLAMLADPNQIPQMMLLGDSALFPDVGVYLQTTYYSTAKGTNKSGYANPELDALLEKAIASGNANERCDLYKKAQQIIDADHVFMPMYWAGVNFAYRSDRMADPLTNAIGYNYAPIRFESLKD
jgi:peptide/nickel transport system substrate-binding protein